jgi:hypothetical protein
MNSATIGTAGPSNRYRVPMSAVVVAGLPGAMIAAAWLVARSSGWWYPALMVAISVTGVVSRLRQGLVLDDDGAHVTLFRSHHVPWSAIRHFEPAPRGGAFVVTDERRYRSVAPCTGWAAPASAQQIAELEAFRLARQA